MFGAGGHYIDAGGIYRRVAQNVGEAGDIAADAVKGSGKKPP